jgi:excisionase family DNA binding protein
MDARELLRPSDIAPLLGVSVNRVYQLIQAGALPAVRMGGAWRVPRKAWEAWLAGQTERALGGMRDEAEGGGGDGCGC